VFYFLILAWCLLVFCLGPALASRQWILWTKLATRRRGWLYDKLGWQINYLYSEWRAPHNQ